MVLASDKNMASITCDSLVNFKISWGISMEIFYNLFHSDGNIELLNYKKQSKPTTKTTTGIESGLNAIIFVAARSKALKTRSRLLSKRLKAPSAQLRTKTRSKGLYRLLIKRSSYNCGVVNSIRTQLINP